VVKRWRNRVQRHGIENGGRTQEAGTERARQKEVTDEVVIIPNPLLVDRVVLAT
jgi:hypothetical protein